jgi:hypothetical protein
MKTIEQIFNSEEIKKISEEVDIVYNKIQNLVTHINSNEKNTYEFDNTPSSIKKFEELFSIYEYRSYLLFIEDIRSIFIDPNTYMYDSNLHSTYKIENIFRNYELMLSICKIMDIIHFLNDMKYMCNYYFKNIKINMRQHRFEYINFWETSYLFDINDLFQCENIFNQFILSYSNKVLEMCNVFENFLHCKDNVNNINNNMMNLLKEKQQVIYNQNIENEITMSEEEILNEEISFKIDNPEIKLVYCTNVMNTLFESSFNAIDLKYEIYSMIIEEFNKFVKNNTLDSEIFKDHTMDNDNIKIIGIRQNNVISYGFYELNQPERVIENSIWYNIRNKVQKIYEKYFNDNYQHQFMVNDYLLILITFYYMYNYDKFRVIIRDFFYKYNDTNVPYIHDNEEYEEEVDPFDFIDNDNDHDDHDDYDENPEDNFDSAFFDQFD